jgi:hypothetical protein
MAALILSVFLPLGAIVVPLLGLPPAVSAVLVGGMLAGGPELLTLLAAALLGKQTLTYLIARAKRLLRQAVLVRPVSRRRYYLGLTLGVVTVIPLYLYGYGPQFMPAGDARIYILAGSDLAFVVGVFLMGGEFWDKLGRLFVWEGAR